MSAVNGFETLAHVLGLRSGPTVFLSIVVRLAARSFAAIPTKYYPWNGQPYEKATETH
jgi:hypothetical protein